MRITIIGLGIVGMSDALSLARKHEVTVTGPLPDRIEAIRRGDYLISDPLLTSYCQSYSLNLSATLDTAQALEGADLVLITSPLGLDPETGGFRTAELESRIEFAHARCPGVPIVIRSAVPIGFTQRMQRRLGGSALTCAPEFRREGAALTDALHPDHITVGDRGPLGARVGRMLASAALQDDVPVRRIGPSEAEAVKHFAQAYLATRVAYFNELDSYALAQGLDARQVIDGVCLDPRIGSYANNPCFGFGGMRLPRSTRQVTDACANLPAHVLPGAERANHVRLGVLTDTVLQRAPRRVGLYRPKVGGAVAAMGDALRERGAIVEAWDGADDSLDAFKAGCDIIVAARQSPELADVPSKVFCRDLYA